VGCEARSRRIAGTRFFIARDLMGSARRIRCAFNDMEALSQCYQQGCEQKLWITTHRPRTCSIAFATIG
jgi:hypothetical protein